MSERFTIAAAAWPIEAPESRATWETRLGRWVEEAAAADARLLVFPEYAAMELAALEPETMGSLSGSLRSVSDLMPWVDALHADLATRHQVHILAGSAPFRRDDGSYVNRARLFAPGGRVGVQDKLMMTRFEREQWHVSAGGPLRLFETDLGRIGVTICYDSEFPLLGRALAEAGCDVLLVPSCTDSERGYWRVRLGAQARALEGQMVTVQAPTVGQAAWSPAVDVNRGAAGLFGPPDRGFPADGVIALGGMDQAGWTYGEADLGAVRAARADGEVLNLRHWSEQPGAAPLPPVEVINLRG